MLIYLSAPLTSTSVGVLACDHQSLLSAVNLCREYYLRACLPHVKAYCLGLATSSKSRISLILVEQVIVTVAQCVVTGLKIEDVLGTSQLESDLLWTAYDGR